MDMRDSGPEILARSLIGFRDRAGDSFEIRVSGKSMSPLIRNGESARVVAVPENGLLPGDLAFFKKEDALVVHRIIGRERRGGERVYCQKGDALFGWSWVREAELLGKVLLPGLKVGRPGPDSFRQELLTAVGTLLAFHETLVRFRGRLKRGGPLASPPLLGAATGIYVIMRLVGLMEARARRKSGTTMEQAPGKGLL